MSETAEKIIYVTTNGPESPEKATLPFKLANAGLALDLDVVMALQGPAVYLAMPGMIPHVPDTNTSSLKQMLEVFVESGGRLLVCIPCMEERNLKETDLIEQAVPTSGSALTRNPQCQSNLDLLKPERKTNFCRTNFRPILDSERIGEFRIV